MTTASTLERTTALDRDLTGLASGRGRPAPVRDAAVRVAAGATVVQHRLRSTAEDRLARSGQSYAAIWIVVILIGIFLIGAAALAIYCIRNGRNGAVLDYRTATIKKWKIPVGIRVSIRCV